MKKKQAEQRRTFLPFPAFCPLLTLSKLRSSACAPESGLLSFFDAAITAEEPGVFECSAMSNVDLRECAADAKTDGITLGWLTAALHRYFYVVFLEVIRQSEWS